MKAKAVMAGGTARGDRRDLPLSALPLPACLPASRCCCLRGGGVMK